MELNISKIVSISISVVLGISLLSLIFVQLFLASISFFCPSCLNVSSKVVFEHHEPEIINTTQAFIDKFNRTPKSFPYRRVDTGLSKEVLMELGESISFQEIATYEIADSYYVTIFLTDVPNRYLEVSWRLSTRKIDILDKKIQEGVFLLRTKFHKETANEGIRYVVEGEATYYEVPIQINSITYVEGAAYHTYDWTTTYAYLGSNLIYSVTAAGDFYWNYGIEIWVYAYAYHETHFFGWSKCWLNKEVSGQYTKAVYVEARGRASALLYVVPPFLSINFENTAQVGHDCWGGENHWGHVDFYHSYGLPCG